MNCLNCGSWTDGGYCYCCGCCTSYGPSTPTVPAQAKPPEVPASVGIFDDHRQCWYPANGKREELGKLIGETFTWDACYGAFFGPPEAK